MACGIRRYRRRNYGLNKIFKLNDEEINGEEWEEMVYSYLQNCPK